LARAATAPARIEFPGGEYERGWEYPVTVRAGRRSGADGHGGSSSRVDSHRARARERTGFLPVADPSLRGGPVGAVPTEGVGILRQRVVRRAHARARAGGSWAVGRGSQTRLRCERFVDSASGWVPRVDDALPLRIARACARVTSPRADCGARRPGPNAANVRGGRVPERPRVSIARACARENVPARHAVRTKRR
jgi:hypothetical protein